MVLFHYNIASLFFAIVSILHFFFTSYLNVFCLVAHVSSTRVSVSFAYAQFDCKLCRFGYFFVPVLLLILLNDVLLLQLELYGMYGRRTIFEV